MLSSAKAGILLVVSFSVDHDHPVIASLVSDCCRTPPVLSNIGATFLHTMSGICFLREKQGLMSVCDVPMDCACFTPLAFFVVVSFVFSRSFG